jgi:LysR family glycine cleavage system transcriptional activator
MSLTPLPPLAALRAFEAAARHKSFTKAANELNMTQAAVSYQIKQLEDRFGEPLFIRGTRHVNLSDAGERLAPSITEAFEMIRRSFAEAKGTKDNVLTITTSQTFASSWLAKHLGSFQMHCNALAVKLDITNESYKDFQSAGVDVAIRTGRGNWPDLQCKPVLRFRYTPLVAPKFIERHGPLNNPQDLLGLPMVAPADPWWETWFAAAGVNSAPLKSKRGPMLSSHYIHGIAAISGDNAAILSPDIYRDELANGTLIQPFDHVEMDELAIWLCYPKYRTNWRKIGIFEDWFFQKLDETMPDRPF